ncbi:MAG TPA: redoxin domain-containing protein [Acidimicrobiia bacterium]|nr:redoxin domain-containing protein [Acidimicrobiia bacterium]
MIAPGQPAPSFQLIDQDKNPVSSDSLKGRKSLVVFIPFPFTGICEGELCTIRDRHAELKNFDANVVIVTCDTVPANKKWSDDNGFAFPVLSDYWPHGATCKAYGTFNDALGVSNRFTFVLDEEGIVRNVISTEALGIAREFDEYTEALAAI